MAIDRVNDDGVIIYGTDTGSVLALDELVYLCTGATGCWACIFVKTVVLCADWTTILEGCWVWWSCHSHRGWTHFHAFGRQIGCEGASVVHVVGRQYTSLLESCGEYYHS